MTDAAPLCNLSAWESGGLTGIFTISSSLFNRERKLEKHYQKCHRVWLTIIYYFPQVLPICVFLRLLGKFSLLLIIVLLFLPRMN